MELIASIKYFLANQYHKWTIDYKSFARMRGFHSFNDWAYHRRGFIECWAQPGFHRFWQIWNPGIAYFVYRLFILLRGRKHWIIPVMAAFTLCGFAHTLIVLPFFGRWSYTLVVAFASFGILTVISRKIDPILHQERWPVFVNVLINVGLVIGAFDLGFRIDRIL